MATIKNPALFLSLHFLDLIFIELVHRAIVGGYKCIALVPVIRNMPWGEAINVNIFVPHGNVRCR